MLDELQVLRDEQERELGGSVSILQVTTRAQARAQSQQSTERSSHAKSELSDEKSYRTRE